MHIIAAVNILYGKIGATLTFTLIINLKVIIK